MQTTNRGYRSLKNEWTSILFPVVEETEKG